MSKKFHLALLAGLCSSFMTGCFFLGSETEVVIEPPPPQPETTAPTESETPTASETPANPSVLSNLTPPTNPVARVNVLVQEAEVGRNNPFANVRPPKPPEVPANGGPGAGNNGTGTSGNGGAVVIPTLPEPKDAQAVQVFGVALVGGSPQAIIRAPGESVTRTVQVGDILANDVRVVQISAFGSTPTVVFEQFGQAVPISVGQPQASI